MKTINAIVKVLTALAAIAGAVYIIATYGDQIVAWAKRMLSAPQVPAQAPAAAPAAPAAEPETPVETSECSEAPAEESAPVEEVPAEETAEAPAAEENAPVADEADFEG